jgi:hypothetical protein
MGTAFHSGLAKHATGWKMSLDHGNNPDVAYVEKIGKTI